MKNKKIIILAVIIIIVVAIIFGFFMAKHNPNYLYNEDGTISDGHKDLIDHLKSIENFEERRKQVDFSLESNLITEQETQGQVP